MKRNVLIGSVALIAFPAIAAAQSVDQKIARAVAAAPAALQAEATVIEFAPDASVVVLRQGTNGLLCWDSTGQHGRFSSQCTSEQNRKRVEQNHRINTSGGTPEEIRAMFEEAERNGTREVAQFGTYYFHIIGDDPATGTIHTTIAVPFATAESLQIPTTRRIDGLWLMDAGTSGAHLMLPGGM
jgi:hypothetical protein